MVEFGRPQAFVPIIGLMKPGMVTTGILFFYLVRSGQIGKNLSRQVTLILLFIVLLAIFVPLARNNFWAYQTVRNMALRIPLLLSVIIVMNSQVRLTALLKGIIAIMIFITCYGLSHGGRGPGGVITDENDLCLFLVTFLPFVFFLFLQTKKTIGKIAYASIVFLVLLTVVATFSRGGFVGLLAMAAVYWIFSRRKILTLFCALLIGCILYMSSGEQYRQEMSTVTDTKENTANARLLSWEAGWKMFKAHPLGIGGNNFPIYFPEYQPEGLRHNMWGRQAHSLWFTLLPETGVVGIIIYFLIIRMNVKDLFFLRGIGGARGREYLDSNTHFMSQLSTAFMASFAGFFASASFISVLYYPEFWYLTVLVVSARNVALKEVRLDFQPSSAQVNSVGFK